VQYSALSADHDHHRMSAIRLGHNAVDRLDWVDSGRSCRSRVTVAVVAFSRLAIERGGWESDVQSLTGLALSLALAGAFPLPLRHNLIDIQRAESGWRSFHRGCIDFGDLDVERGNPMTDSRFVL
jgi:hypothetical protein